MRAVGPLLVALVSLGLAAALAAAPVGVRARRGEASSSRRMPAIERLLHPLHLEGRVARTLPAGPYTYLTLVGTGEPRWLVTLGSAPDAGDAVVVTVYGTRRDFFSARLGRSFATLGFARIQRAPAAPLTQTQETP